MVPIRRLIAGLKALLRSHRVEQELDEELRAYLETSIEEKVRGGMAHEDAIRATRVEAGSLEAVKDHVRDVVYRRCRPHSGTRHRRQHGNLQRGQFNHAPAAAGRAPRRVDLARCCVPERCGTSLFLFRLPANRDRCGTSDRRIGSIDGASRRGNARRAARARRYHVGLRKLLQRVGDSSSDRTYRAAFR